MIDILILIHSEESTAGTVPDWCAAHDLSCLVTTAKEFVSRSSPPAFRGLIVCGGDMEAWETERHPWLTGEKALIRDAIARDRPVFGICLGSQLLAEQLGAELQAMGRWELGWFPVVHNGQTLTPFHCHSSRFTDVPGSRATAHNDHQSNQAFESGKYRGVQFHIEIDETRMKHILKNVKVPDEGFVQPKTEFMASFETFGDALKTFCFEQLTSWWRTRDEISR